MSTTVALPVLVERLHQHYPNARYELNWDNPAQLLVATILAAQCTDDRVNQVTAELFRKYPDAPAFAAADRAELEEGIKLISFHRTKAEAIQEACKAIVERYNGEVPASMDELTTLPRVARKTANVVLNTGFQLPAGVIVDTHVARVSRRMGLSVAKTPEKIERDLMASVPRDEWIHFGPAVVLHGRYTCTARDPKCDRCGLADLCPKLLTEEEPEEPEEAPTAAKTDVATKKKSKPAAKTPKTAVPVPSLAEQLPPDWRAALQAEFGKPYFKALEKFVAQERAAHQVFPPAEDLFNAFKATPFDQVKVLLLGQDPYHDDGQAHGMCFSVRPGVKPPPSLVNVFKELNADLGCPVPPHGHLAAWAQQGVLLLNAVLTVRAHEAASHKEKGWETFTDSVIQALNARPQGLVFMLWGSYAKKKAALIDTKKHRVLQADHPSPLSSKKFFGSRPFSGANTALQELGLSPIDWTIPADPKATTQTTTPVPAPPPPAPKPVVAAPRPVVAPAHLPEDWQKVLAAEFTKPYFAELEKFLSDERRTGGVVPAEEDVYAAFRLTPADQVKAVIVGDVPPGEKGCADGLAFSLKPGVTPTAAHTNLFHELRDDLGCWTPTTASLVSWARQGVLLLNSVLTAREDRPQAHRDKGWERFTDAVVQALSNQGCPRVFLLWGAAAQKKAGLIDGSRHIILAGPHPGDDRFRGTRPFSRINAALEMRGVPSIYWQLFAA